jgi:hypothetical protein
VICTAAPQLAVGDALCDDELLCTAEELCAAELLCGAEEVSDADELCDELLEADELCVLLDVVLPVAPSAPAWALLSARNNPVTATTSPLARIARNLRLTRSRTDGRVVCEPDIGISPRGCVG